MNWFDLLPESPNVVAPHKKIEMCMSPCQIWKDDKLFAALGTPGSHGILQTTAQMILNLIEHEMNIQAAIEAPRVRIEQPGTDVGIEERISSQVREELTARGHDVRVLPAWTAAAGGGQGIIVECPFLLINKKGHSWAELIPVVTDTPLEFNLAHY